MREAIAVLIGFLVGCKGHDVAPAAPARVAASVVDAGAPRPPDAHAPDAGPPALETSHLAAAALPAGVTPHGALEDAYTFVDAHGANYVLFSSRRTGGPGDRSAYLFVDHWLVAPGAAPRAVATIRDLVEHCAGEPIAAFHDVLDLGDVDHDGVAEVAIGYEVGCRTAPSPVTYKLITVEDGVKYALRGETKIPPGGTAAGGTFTPDPAFEHAPAGLLDHAKALWAKSDDDLVLVAPPDGSADATPYPRFEVDTVGAADLPRGLRHAGELGSARRFDDANGTNYVLFSYGERCVRHGRDPLAERTIYVDHYAVPRGGRPEKLASRVEQVDQCPAPYLELSDDGFEAIDLDYDGVAEVTYATQRVCFSEDVSIPEATLVVLGDPPRSIDGQPLHGDADAGDSLSLQPEAGDWPPALLAHARATWRAAAVDHTPSSVADAVRDGPCAR